MIYKDGQISPPHSLIHSILSNALQRSGKISYLFVVHLPRFQQLRLYTVQGKSEKLVNNEEGRMQKEMVVL
jgi:hypothetical protein